MDLGVSETPGIIASGTTQYIAQFSDIFVLVFALVLALGVISALMAYFFGSKGTGYFEHQAPSEQQKLDADTIFR